MKRYWFCAKAVLYKKRGCFAWLHLLDLSWGKFGTVQQCFMNIQTIRIKKLLNPCDQKFHQLKYTTRRVKVIKLPEFSCKRNIAESCDPN